MKLCPALYPAALITDMQKMFSCSILIKAFLLTCNQSPMKPFYIGLITVKTPRTSHLAGVAEPFNPIH